MANLPEDRLECLVSSWLLSREGEVGRKSALKKALRSLVGEAPGSNPNKQIDEAIDSLRRKGSVHESKPGRLSLEPQGKASVLESLGVSALPRSAKGAAGRWRWIRATNLVRIALGLEATNAGFKRVKEAKDLKAQVLQRHHGLSLDRPLSLTEVIDILFSAALGAARVVPRDARTPILRKWLTEGKKGKSGDAVTPSTSVPVSMEGSPAMRHEVRPPDDHGPLDLSDFARRVLAAAKRSPTGHRDGDKVFVSHVFREMKRGHEIDGMTLPDFKQRLVEANKKALLRLSRADSVEGMAREDVTESEISFLSATFHFVRID